MRHFVVQVAMAVIVGVSVVSTIVNELNDLFSHLKGF